MWQATIANTAAAVSVRFVSGSSAERDEMRSQFRLRCRRQSQPAVRSTNDGHTHVLYCLIDSFIALSRSTHSAPLDGDCVHLLSLKTKYRVSKDFPVNKGVLSHL